MQAYSRSLGLVRAAAVVANQQTQALGAALQAYPHLSAWVQRFQARPAYRQALEQGGEYAFAK